MAVQAAGRGSLSAELREKRDEIVEPLTTVEAAGGADRMTQDVRIEILGGEVRQRRLLEGFLPEFERQHE
jgi:hypothetical protein